MKPHRKIRPHQPAYPTRAQVRDALATGLAAASLGALLTSPAVAQPPPAQRTAGVPPPPKDEPQPPQADEAQLVARLAGQLGNPDSRVREEASRALIALAIRCEQQGDQTVFPHKAAVLDAMRRLEKDTDPEVAQRAGEVIRAVEEATAATTPPPTPPLGGVIALPEPGEPLPEIQLPPQAE